MRSTPQRTTRPAALLGTLAIAIFAIAAFVLGAPFIAIVIRIVLIVTLIGGTVLCVYLTISLFKSISLFGEHTK